MEDFLKKLNSKNITVNLIGDQLDIKAPKGVMTEILLSEIQENKKELISFISRNTSDVLPSYSIPKATGKTNYPLSSSQFRLWLLDQIENDLSAYNMPSIFSLTGKVEIIELENAFNQLVKRHEILRTNIIVDNETGVPRQYISSFEKSCFTLNHIDISKEKNVMKSLEQIKEAEVEYKFNLESEPLLRVTTIKKANDDYILIIVMHHIISDGWSSSIIIRDLFSLYQALLKKEHNPLGPLPFQYKDYAEWQHSNLHSEAIELDKKYWLNQFKNEIPILDIPTYKVRPLNKTYQGKTIEKLLSKDLLLDFKNTCRAEGATLFMGFMATVNILLYKYTNQSEIIIGTPFAGRDSAELQNQIGFYVNTIGLKTSFTKEETFKTLLAQIKKTTLDAKSHQNYPFDELIKDLNIQRDKSRNPLFDILLRIDNNDNVIDDYELLSGLFIKELTFTDTTSKFDLEFSLREDNEQSSLSLTYNTDIFTDEFIQQATNHLEVIFNNVIEDSKIGVINISYLTTKERQKLLYVFNNSQIDLIGVDKTLIDLFEDQVKKTPDHTAVVFGDKEMTYFELNRHANQLSQYLRKTYTIGTNDIIGIKLQRSDQLLVAILGVLKTGAAYVPIDMDYPIDRINFIMEDCNCKVVIDHDELENFIEIRDQYNGRNVSTNVSSTDLAYLIYTSGSTGNPKGVMVEHRNTVAMIHWAQDEFDIDKFDIVYWSTSHCFDLSIYEIFYPLSVGKKIRVLENALETGITFIEDERVLINSVPSNIRNLIDNGNTFDNVSIINIAGEQFPIDIANRLSRTNAEVRNLYGPTENTTYSTSYKLSSNEHWDKSIPIGKPISNTFIYVLGDDLEPVPIGVPGKLFISGVGVARGYLNRPELTAERFIPNPFIEGERMYYTGDIAKWLPDGNLEFLGREDNQVKIRGYRIELGEIENTIIEYSEDIQQVVLDVKQPRGENELVVYYVSGSVLENSALKSFLLERLPSYMVPNYYKSLGHIPLTPNGKIDRQALPEVTSSSVVRRDYVAPDSDLERALVGIWQEVLGIDSIGITDNFFDLGGHSLLVGQIINRIYQQLNKSISFKSFFETPVIGELSKSLSDLTFTSISLAPEMLHYPLTPSQHRIWVLSQLEGGGLAYNMQGAVKLKGELDVKKFEEAFKSLITRHEVLRTNFKINESGEIYQYIISEGDSEFKLSEKDLTNQTKEEIDKLLQEEHTVAFDLSNGSLLRVTLFKTEDQEFIFSLTMHHIIGDGWSMELLISEVIASYNNLAQNEEYSLPKLDIQYKDYAVWLKSELTKEAYKESEMYWLSQFEGELPVLDLPSFTNRPRIRSYNGKTVTRCFSSSFLGRLKKFSKSNDVTLFMTLMSGFNALLYRYTNQNDIIIGTPIAGREHPDLEGQIGLYLNTLAIRTTIGESYNFLDLLEHQKQALISAYEHQKYPFDELVTKLDLRRDNSRSALFDVMIVLQSQAQLHSVKTEKKLEGIQVEDYEVNRNTSQFDLVFTFLEKENLELSIEYNSDIYDNFLIERMFSHYENLMNEVIEDPTEPLPLVNYLTKYEEQQLLEGFNNTTVDYPKDKTVIELFEEQVIKTPNNIAVVFEEQKLTYSELNAQANQLAQYLREKYSIKPDDLIGVELERGEQLLVTIFGILKSGAAYIPIDVNYPQERINYIQEDSNCKVIIDQQELKAFTEVKENYDLGNLPVINKSNNLAYIIYTSGTTGKPKGVMVEHRSIGNLALAHHQKFSITSDSKVLQYAPLVFDASVSEIFSTLLFGAQLLLVSTEIRKDASLLSEFLNSSKVNIATIPPIVLNEISNKEFLNLETLVVAGESSSENLKNTWSKGRILIHAYGPTEGTVCTTLYRYEEGKLNASIGSPIDNTKVFVLDGNRVLVPIGVIGELYIGGAGLSRGYLNREQLTKERFISNPFATESDLSRGYNRLYKTGDLVRWLADGTLEYIGRNDDQVKIRGYRIELGEIESALTEIEGIVQACVLAKERTIDLSVSKYLVGYYILEEGEKILSEQVILEKLSERLPDYMVPSTLIKMDSFPLTVNGKLDKRALPEADFNLSEDTYVAPETDTEKALCKIWEEVLGLEKVGVTDNLFRIGGDSILSIRLSHRMSSYLKKDIKVADIFKYKTVSELLFHSVGTSEVVIEKIPAKESVLSFAQERLWFIEQYSGGTNAYHTPVVLELSSNTDVEGIKHGLSRIVSRHEVLRSRILEGGSGEGVQVVEDFPLSIKEISLGLNEDYESVIREGINTHFDLSVDYPIRIHLYYIIDKESKTEGPIRTILLINIHHIASDGWSMKVFEKELHSYYVAYLRGDREFKLPALGIQYKDYARWQRSYLTGEVVENQLSYWKGKLSGFETLAFPTDYPRPSTIDYKGSQEAFTLSNRLSAGLRNLAKKYEVTLHSVLLSSINILMYKYTGQEDIVIGSPIANRDHPQTRNLIGFFVNPQVNRTILDKGQSYGDLIKQVHQDQESAQLYQDLPFERLVDELDVERDTSRHPIFQVWYDFHSFDYPSQEMSGIKTNLTPINLEKGLEVAKFDLSIVIDDSEEEISVKIDYATSLFKKDTIVRLSDYFLYLLEQIVVSPEHAYGQVSLLNSSDYQRILHDWNTTDVIFDEDKTLVDLFEAQVMRTPGATALVYEETELSYDELNRRSNQLARHLREIYQDKNGIDMPPDTCIGLYLDRGVEMVVTILGILKAGGAYIPISINYPQDRILYILEDTQAEFLLTETMLMITSLSDIELPNCEFIAVDLIEGVDTTNLLLDINSKDLAYVIYTSGTTGKPKGVMIEHNSLNNLVTVQNRRLGITSESNMLQYASIVFDASVWEIFSSLTLGAKLFIASKEVREDAILLKDFLINNKITIALLPPTLLGSIPSEKFKTLKTLLIGGDISSSSLMDLWSETRVLINAYGPTEGAVCVTMHNYSKGDSNTKIGNPLGNTKVYVLDGNRVPVPIGIIGELYIGGAGLSRGYLNREQLTKERFISNPFATESDLSKGYDRLYKTGDLVRWLADGTLEYIGRNDDQVKIRGYRIELGEIESALTETEGIVQACVLAKERTIDLSVSKYLVGYYKLEEGEKILSEQVILEKLSERLPDYMVPSTLIKMDSFPLTVNGKLDKRALPEADFNLSEDTYVAPETDTEKALCKIWEEVLGLEKVGVTDNLFRIGGDSILSIQISSRIRQFGFHCDVQDIFKYNTISKLSAQLDKKKTVVNISGEQGLLTGEFGLLPIQEWFIERVNSGLLKEPNHWNQSFLIRVPELNLEKLGGVIEELVSYHDMLRILYIREEGSYRKKQVYQSSIPLPKIKALDIRLCSEEDLHKELTEWQSCFDLKSGPLFQVGYLHGYEDGSARIYFALHHLLVDGVSWRILSEDIKTLYTGEILPAKGSSYRQWVSSVKSYVQRYPEESDYWESQLSETSVYDPDVLSADSSTRHFELDELATKFLLQEASKAYQTEINDLLLTALSYALRDINGEDIQGITLEGHGRESIDSSIDHSHTLGWFTSLFPVKLEVKDSIRKSIQFIKERLRTIPNKGIGFGAFAVEKVSGYTFDDLVPVSFNYLGQFGMGQSIENWQLISENTGVQVSPLNTDHNVININGGVVNDKLSFSINSKLGGNTTQELCTVFKAQLENVIEHCKKSLASTGVSYTPSDFRSVRISQSLLDRLQENAKASANEVKHIYRANSLQQGFIFHSISQPEDDAYRIQLLFDYHDALDVPKYIKAWEHCIAQYPSLRTGFNWEEEPIQIVYKEGVLDYELHDISDLSSDELKDKEIEKIQALDRKCGFDLNQPSLFRLHIIKQSSTCYTIIKHEHHSISDGWSAPVLLKSLQDYYQSLLAGGVITVKEDNAYLEAQDYIAAKKSNIAAYWEQKILEVEGANDINGLLSKPIDLSSYKHVEKPLEQNLEIEGALYKDLKLFSLREGITVNVIVQFIWHKLLQGYSNMDYSIVGTTVSGRDLPIEGIENSVGLYINTLPLVVKWKKGDTILSQLHQTQKQITDLNSNSYVDLAKLQRSGARLFHSLLVFDNYPGPKENVKDISKLRLRYVIAKVDYPLIITAHEYSDVLSISLGYDGHYMTEGKANAHMKTFERLLGEVIKNSETAQEDISLLSITDYQEVVYDWNATDAAYDMGGSLVSLFEAQVAESPDAVALVYEGEMLTYGELNAKSNQLARHIRSTYYTLKGEAMPLESCIGLYLERGFDMVISMLGVLKAGGAYVPIDPDYPADRVRYILEDSGSKFILTQTMLMLDNLSDVELPSDLIAVDLIETEDSGNLGLPISSDSLAYVIYTSGTTGKPKGVMVEHKSVAYYLNSYKDLHPTGPIRVCSVLNYCFDASVPTLLLNVIGNSTVHILNNHYLKNEQIVNYVNDHQINSIRITPSMLEFSNFEDVNNKLTVVMGGERFSILRIQTLLENQYITIYNQYGPTECTVGSTVKRLDESVDYQNIGKGYPSKRIYVLDNSGHPVPVGVAGELYIGGAGVSRGYLNREALTSERFVLNRFASKSDRSKGYDRLYKTGDLVRWHSDGNLEYLGRNDDQVKIRGYRIELGEIESALSSIGGVSQSCVLSKERTTDSGESKYLVGYYVLEEGSEELTEEYLLEALSSLVPDYMIPSRLIVLEQFPLTVNGKLDRRSLPEVESLSGEDEYVAPQSETERSLCKIWEEVLGVSRVGVTDNFFRIGGDSILSIQISTRIRQLGFHCNVQDIFEYNNVSRLASYLDHHVADKTLEGEQGLLRGTFGLLPIQARFIEEANSGFYPVPQHMNQSFMIRVPSLDTDRLSKVLSSLVAYHDMFRVHYFRVGGELAMHQEYQPEISVPALKILDVREYSESELHRELTLWQSAFDLESGPLFQVGYLYGYEDGNARVYFALHHLLVDGVSWRILSEDLKTLYDGGTLPAKGSSYREWVSAVSAYPDSHAEESDYWAGALSGVSNYSRETMISSSSVESVEFEESSTKFLLQEASKAYQTEINDLLLTALAYALRDVDGELAHGITLEGHGREAIASSIDHSHTLGWFTSVFPVKLELGADLRESIQGIKESLRNIPNKGIGFGSFAVSDSTSYGFKDLVPINFNYLGQFGNDTTLDWQLVAEDAGAQMAPSNCSLKVINFNGAVINEKLSFSIASKLGEETTHQLCTGFKEHLEAIIAHCQESLSSSGASYTPSDFSTVEVSQSLLDKLQNNLNTGNEE